MEQGNAAVRMARASGIDTNGFFMLGLSPDTEQTTQDTINFASKIPVDMMKFGLAIAFPGTPMFSNYLKKNLIKSFDWDEYFIYTDKPLFSHEQLTYDTIQRYTGMAYRKCILFNPAFILRRLVRGFRTGEFFWDLFSSIRFFLIPAVVHTIKSDYYAKDRWPKWNFRKNLPTPASYQIVRKE